MARPRPGSDDDPPAPSPTFELTLPAQLAAAWLTRARVRDWLESHAVAPGLVDDIEYMTSEAVSNSAEHAYPAETVDGTIHVAAELLVVDAGLRRVRVVVRDYGRWQPVDPDPGHRGHGLAAMVALAAEITIRHYHDDARGGTEVTLLSAVTAQAGAPSTTTSSAGV